MSRIENPTWTGTAGGLLIAAAAAFSAASGLIHFAAVGEHWATYPAAAVFFIALGLFQVVWAALLIGRPGRWLYAAGAAASLATIAIWAVSRTSGLPIGPFAGIPERVGRADVIATVFEEALVIAIMLLTWGPGLRRRIQGATYQWGLAIVLAAVCALAFWALTAAHGGVGHGSGSLLAHLGHHGLHLIFAGGAVAVFAGYVVAYVRRNGWPAFSWGLDGGVIYGELRGGSQP